jgi:glycogen operon protein
MKSTSQKKKLRIQSGVPLPLGATITPDGVNFSIFSRHAHTVSLLLFKPGTGPKYEEIVLDPDINRTGDVWHVLVCDLDKSLRYGYRMDGPFSPEDSGHFFQKNVIVLDPYAKALTGGTHWGDWYTRKGRKSAESNFLRRCCIVDEHFDWEGDRPLNIPLRESIIYELHVRGFTCDQSSKVSNPGTYDGIIEKIPYLKKLGITAVELMPVTEFYENENTRHDPVTGERLKNFWGYSPLAFFAPKASFAVSGVHGNQVKEFKGMVKALHKAGIEVILDIVFNHTAEGGMDGPVYSFRGIDNTIYYLLGSNKEYLNFSGCGNTLNCNHPLVRSMIMDCLRYWVTEMHIDGFRFDLASILGRDSKGEVLRNPPVVEQIAEDPILANTKIIAEAWDAAGLYQVGSFSEHARWAEWNGRFRDDIRAFMCGKEGAVPALATRIAGSADLYQGGDRRPFNSINFVTSHDGFTMYDLVSYSQKHNWRNGEENRDGDNHNISWNSGVEGETTDEEILRLRFRRMKTFAVLLFLSQGTPMLVAGDEFGRTQGGNNNAYCQDNEISWINWNLAQSNSGLLRFYRLLIRLRKDYEVFRREDFFHDLENNKIQEIVWQTENPEEQDWSFNRRSLGFRLQDVHAENKSERADFLVMVNSGEDTVFTLPKPCKGHQWYQVIDTALDSPHDILEESQFFQVRTVEVKVASMAAIVLVSRRKKK